MNKSTYNVSVIKNSRVIWERRGVVALDAADAAKQVTSMISGTAFDSVQVKHIA